MDDILTRAKKVKLLLLDVDGVLTDGRIIYGTDGHEMKNYDVTDGLGITLLNKAGLRCAIITAKGSSVVRKRAVILGIHKVYSDFHFKIRALKSIKRHFRVAEDEICYIGDDLVDIPLLKRVGMAVSVPNAVRDAKKVAHYITKNAGGRGAVREICELILKAQNKWISVTKEYFQ